MTTSSHTNADKLQELFNALPQAGAGDSFEQETMCKVHLAAQERLKKKERRGMLASILWAAMAAAGITAAIVSGIGWLREQPQPALPLLQGVSTEQLLRSLEVGGLWMLVVGIFIVLISMPGKNYSG